MARIRRNTRSIAKLYRALALQTGLGQCVLVAGLTATAGVALHAQVLYGTITGTITDPTGAVVPGAHIRLTNQNTGLVRQLDANGAGEYSAGNLEPGTYRLTVTDPGFTTYQQSGAAVAGNQILRVDATLKLGETSQVVDVTTAPPQLQTEEASTNYNITSEQIQNLPTTSSTGRNVQALYRLIPGATPPYEANSQAANPQRSEPINVNGQSYDINTQRLDGAVDQNPWLPNLVAYLPPPDAIQTINAVTASFNAEQGSAGGAAINYTIRTGTNHFHGSAWAYNSIAQFNAHAWNNRTGTLPKNIYNEDGGSLGGPLIKDKLFFFGDFNRVTTRSTLSGIYSVPTAAMRAGNFLGTGVTIYDPATGSSTGAGKQPFANDSIPLGRISPAASKLLAALPLPTTSGLVNNYAATAVNAFNRNSADLKITYNPTQATTFFGRYSYSPNDISDPQVFGPNPGGPTIDGGQPGVSAGRIQNVGLGATHAFTPHFAIDANGGFSRMRVNGNASDEALGDYGTNTLGIPGTNNSGQALYSGIPGFTFSTYTALGNSTTSNPFLFRDMVYTGNVNGTYTHSTHSIRFGGEYIHYQLNHFQAGSATSVSTNPRGSFGFSGIITAASGAGGNNVSSIGDFLLGQAISYNKAVQVSNPLTLRYSSFAFYAQDTWNATRNLTLDYGLRYEFYPLPVSDHYGTVRYDPSYRSTVTDSFGTHTVGTVLVGGKAGIPYHAGITNGWGMIVPRLGIAYRIGEKTVVRSGFGVTVDSNSLRSVLNQYPGAVATSISNSSTAATSLNPGLLSTTTTVGIPGFAIPDFNQGYIPLPAAISTFTIPQDFRRGYIESYNLTVQHQFPARFNANVGYVGANAIRQQTYLNINASPIGGGTTTGRLLNTTYGPNTNNTDIQALVPFRGANFNSLQAQLSRTGSRIADFGIVYTLSKAMNAVDNTQNGLAFNYPAYWDRDWALAGTDHKHDFQWWTIERLPFGQGQQFLQHGLAGYLLGGWQLNTVLSVVSGTPFTVTYNAPSADATAGNTQVADRVPGVRAVLNSNVNGYRQYLNPAAFAPVTGVRLGTVGRNSVRGPGSFDLDAGLRREFPLHESLKLAFEAESFNVTNTPSFSNPASNISNGGFGTITSAGAARSMRLSGRIEF